MTVSGPPVPLLVLDTMVLSHFTLADRLDVLQDLLIDADCWTTQVVIEELRAGAITVPTGWGWLQVES